MNDGRIRVLFGSTSMLGTGVNAQRRAVAIHHIDVPWRPSDFKQRNGRAARKGNEIAKLYADNKVDVVLYAVNKSLDSYKFNVLNIKELFINQLKHGTLGCRTIDGSILDENAGSNSSEYVAILSGNTDLLEKSKIEKKIMALESEHKSFTKAKSGSAWKLQEGTRTLDHNNEQITRMSADYQTFTSRAQTDEDGYYRNPVRLNDLQATDVKSVGTRLQEIAQNATTDGQYTPIGELYGFPILVKTETAIRDGMEEKQNRFFIEGAYKYTYNNGQLAMADHKAAATNFLNALERIPKLIEQFKTQNVALERDLPTLREVVNGTWKKEDELKLLTLELSALERKIQLTLIPPEQHQTTENAAEKVQEAIASPISIGNSILTVAGIDKSSEPFIKEHVLVVRPATIENRDGKRMKL